MLVLRHDSKSLKMHVEASDAVTQNLDFILNNISTIIMGHCNQKLELTIQLF